MDYKILICGVTLLAFASHCGAKPYFYVDSVQEYSGNTDAEKQRNEEVSKLANYMEEAIKILNETIITEFKKYAKIGSSAQVSKHLESELKCQEYNKEMMKVVFDNIKDFKWKESTKEEDREQNSRMENDDDKKDKKCKDESLKIFKEETPIFSAFLMP